MSVQRSIRTTPILVKDCNTADQLINGVIYKTAGTHRTIKEWAKDVQSQLLAFEIILGIARIIEIIRDLKRCRRRRDAATMFKKELAARTGKDRMYAEFGALVRLIHAQEGVASSYVGLPANQVLHVYDQYGSVLACETNKKTFEVMNNMVSIFEPNGNIQIVRQNILKYLEITDQTFTVFDIDLMSSVSPASIQQLIDGIFNCMDEFALVCVVSSIGRQGCSFVEYKELMPSAFVRSAERIGLEVERLTSGEINRYNDGVTPMCYEHFLIYR